MSDLDSQWEEAIARGKVRGMWTTAGTAFALANLGWCCGFAPIVGVIWPVFTLIGIMAGFAAIASAASVPADYVERVGMGARVGAGVLGAVSIALGSLKLLVFIISMMMS